MEHFFKNKKLLIHLMKNKRVKINSNLKNNLYNNIILYQNYMAILYKNSLKLIKTI
jgi:hypothetical protein